MAKTIGSGFMRPSASAGTTSAPESPIEQIGALEQRPPGRRRGARGLVVSAYQRFIGFSEPST